MAHIHVRVFNRGRASERARGCRGASVISAVVIRATELIHDAAELIHDAFRERCKLSKLVSGPYVRKCCWQWRHLRLRDGCADGCHADNSAHAASSISRQSRKQPPRTAPGPTIMSRGSYFITRCSLQLAKLTACRFSRDHSASARFAGFAAASIANAVAVAASGGGQGARSPPRDAVNADGRAHSSRRTARMGCG